MSCDDQHQPRTALTLACAALALGHGVTARAEVGETRPGGWA